MHLGIGLWLDTTRPHGVAASPIADFGPQWVDIGSRTELHPDGTLRVEMDPDYEGYVTTSPTFDLVGTFAQVEVIFGDEAFWAVEQSPGIPGPYVDFGWTGDGVPYQSINIARDQNDRLIISDYDTTYLSFPWDAVAMRWWRMREENGTLYWDVSPDGITWTNLHSVVNTTAPLVDGEFKLSAGANFLQESEKPKYVTFANFSGPTTFFAAPLSFHFTTASGDRLATTSGDLLTIGA